MPENRRSFIKKFGITLGALIASGALPGCGPRKEGELSNTQSQVRRPNEPTPTARAAEWEQLRQCWLKLDSPEDIRNSLREEMRPGGFSLMSSREILAKRHQAILDTLVAKGQVKEPVAQYMQMAFDEAVLHVLIVSSQMTCYIVMPLEAEPREDLCQQAEALRKISGNLDPATVAKAQAAITQDIAFLHFFRTLPKGSLSLGTCPDKTLSLVEDYGVGKLKASPEELEAARLLTALFLEKAD